MRILCSDSGANLAKSLEEKDVQHEITLHTLLDKVQALLLDTSQDLQPHWMTHHGCASRQTHHQIVGVHVLGAHPIRPETTRHIALPTGLVERCAAACTILIKTVIVTYSQYWMTSVIQLPPTWNRPRLSVPRQFAKPSSIVCAGLVTGGVRKQK